MPQRAKEVVVRPQPSKEDKGGAPSGNKNTEKKNMRQTKLFNYAIPTTGSSHNKGQQKLKTDFEQETQRSTPWGDPVKSRSEVESTNSFRLISHNVNGLSTADNNEDVRRFAKAMQHKGVAVCGIQETNRNFGKGSLVASFHNIIKNVSTHHRGAVSSAKIDWPTDYQPGGTAVSVRNKWVRKAQTTTGDGRG